MIVALPPLPEQQEIVRRVEALFAFADRIEARLTEAQQNRRPPDARRSRQSLSRRTRPPRPQRRTRLRTPGKNPSRSRQGPVSQTEKSRPKEEIIMFKRDRVFRDPVHGLIHISPKDEFLTELIDTPEFQRLHRVRQLGVGSMTFPGADHTRFCHSLGVLHIATRVLEVLKKRYADSPIERTIGSHESTIKAAALLHDIGHGPFSHLVERAFESGKDHEERTKAMISSQESEIFKTLDRNGLDPDAVKQVIDHQFPCLFLQDIVSSQLDADRMDYLARDSHFAGVSYGVFDLEWILNTFCIGSYAPDLSNSKLWRLSLDRTRGLQAAEQLILARQHMSLQVYYHRSTATLGGHLPLSHS